MSPGLRSQFFFGTRIDQSQFRRVEARQSFFSGFKVVELNEPSSRGGVRVGAFDCGRLSVVCTNGSGDGLTEAQVCDFFAQRTEVSAECS